MTKERDQDAVAWEILLDDVGESLRRSERQWLTHALDEAERLIEDGWTTDDFHTGIVYKPGTVSARRVSVQVYVMISAMHRGMGWIAKKDREAKERVSSERSGG